MCSYQALSATTPDVPSQRISHETGFDCALSVEGCSDLYPWSAVYGAIFLVNGSACSTCSAVRLTGWEPIVSSYDPIISMLPRFHVHAYAVVMRNLAEGLREELYVCEMGYNTILAIHIHTIRHCTSPTFELCVRTFLGCTSLTSDGSFGSCQARQHIHVCPCRADSRLYASRLIIGRVDSA
jgi:hypothetical protein